MDDAPHEADRTLCQLLAERAIMDGDRVAIDAGAQVLDFRQLGTRSDDLARRLRDRGVVAHDVVAVAMPRSLELVVAALAILKAGAVVLPLDLQAPDTRNRKLLDRAGAKWSVIGGGAPPSCVLNTMTIAADACEAPSAQEDPLPEVGSDHEAFLIFTSGSSGEPKGVRVSHGSLVFRSMVDIADTLLPTDRYLFRTRPAIIGFPMSVALLAAGVTMVIATDGEADDASEMVRVIEERRVTFTGMPPRLIEQMLAIPDVARRLRCLRALRSAGESLSPKLAARFLKEVPTCHLLDGYGTTETLGVVMQGDVLAEAVDAGRPPTVKALSGARVRVVDEAFALADDGRSGLLRRSLPWAI